MGFPSPYNYGSCRQYLRLVAKRSNDKGLKTIQRRPMKKTYSVL
jgi:hypothetical protein